MDNDITDSLNDLIEKTSLRNQPLFKKRQVRLLIIAAFLLAVAITVVLGVILYLEKVLSQMSVILLIGLEFVGVPLASLFLSLMLSAIPIRGRSYDKKFYPVTLLITIILFFVQLLFVFVICYLY